MAEGSLGLAVMARFLPQIGATQYILTGSWGEKKKKKRDKRKKRTLWPLIARYRIMTDGPVELKIFLLLKHGLTDCKPSWQSRPYKRVKRRAGQPRIC